MTKSKVQMPIISSILDKSGQSPNAERETKDQNAKVLALADRSGSGVRLQGKNS